MTVFTRVLLVLATLFLLVTLFLKACNNVEEVAPNQRTYEVTSISETDLWGEEVSGDQKVLLYLDELDFAPLLGDVLVVTFGEYEDDVLAVTRKE